MSDEEKKDDAPHDETKREIFFLPPLKMVLAFFDKESRKQKKDEKNDEKKEETVEKNVERLIEKLSKKDE